MAVLDWSQCPAVESVPGKVSGAWVFKDTRMPVSIVFENLEAGASISEIMDWFHLSREQIVAVIEFAARSLDAPPPSQQFAQTADVVLVEMRDDGGAHVTSVVAQSTQPGAQGLLRADLESGQPVVKDPGDPTRKVVGFGD